MKPGLLESQFATLEEPATGPGTDAVAVDITQTIDQIVAMIVETFSLRSHV